MVSAKRAMESEYLTAKNVQDSLTKKLVIIGEGEYENTDYGVRLTLPVEIDGLKKKWRPSKDSCKNLARDCESDDTNDWVGKPVSLGLVSISGQDRVVAKGLA